MSVARHQTLRVLDGSYVLDRPADVTDVDLRADVLAVVFGPDGSTVMRRNDAGEDAWSALWNGDEAHDMQATCPCRKCRSRWLSGVLVLVDDASGPVASPDRKASRSVISAGSG